MPHSATSVPTLLVIGCTGQVGLELQHRLAAVGRVVALDRANCDLTSPDVLRKTVRELCPDVIVNAAGYTDVDKAEIEAELAFAVNAAAVGALAEEARALGSLLVHYSTDYVFDGRKPEPYVESDPANPLSVYGKSKLAGEIAIAESGARALTLRTGWVASVHGANFAKTILTLGRERDGLSVIDDRFGAPTTAELLARVTSDVIRRYWRFDDREAFPSGIYHLAAGGRASWYAYAVEVLAYAKARGVALRVSPEQVQAIPAAEYPQRALRPKNSCLDTRKLRCTFGIELEDWRSGVHRLLDQVL
ncbi:dTDP-4-dehydrorhamnose reductase [Ralstonia sp. A12]|uniref:dTDP-4-dehydrorhamnose reductase n=1 Tax=Ralstonia sp. A12 TaxID=1217052 RepID=UPI000574D061|nr:dTDP-4-dehydrorhamnose reductase [Ralstonia sp. A12]KHK56100.1 dTDP-4-dehydrorhamnose reductase [Ralstonia sp. A12]